jgi:hypothetical protein
MFVGMPLPVGPVPGNSLAAAAQQRASIRRIVLSAAASSGATTAVKLRISPGRDSTLGESTKQ